MDKKHVLVIPSWYPTKEIPINGSFFKEQSEALKEIGLNIGVIYPEIRPISLFNISEFKENHFQIEVENENGINIIRMHGWNTFPLLRKKEADFWISQTLKLYKIYVEKFGKPDIIHAHSVLWGGYAAYLISKEHSIPYVITEHSSRFILGTVEEWKIPYVEVAFNSANEVYAVSDFLREKLKSYIKDREIHIVYNMVDTEYFKPDNLKLNDKKEETKEFVFCSVAMLKKSKGMHILIEAFSKAFKDKKDVKLQIGGYGEEHENLEHMIEELTLQESVKLLGALNRDDVKKLMQESNCFALASQYETFGIVFIEAMSMGLPVIATNCGSAKELINSEVGIVVDKDDIDNLSKAMLNIYENYNKYNKNNIREYIERTYSTKAIVKLLDSKYDNITKA